MTTTPHHSSLPQSHPSTCSFLTVIAVLVLTAPLAFGAPTIVQDEGSYTGVGTANASVVVAVTQKCNDDEVEYNDLLRHSTRNLVCGRVLDAFGTCDEGCADYFESLEDVAISCTIDGWNMKDLARSNGERCKLAQVKATDWYTPVQRPNASSCWGRTLSDWQETYGAAMYKGVNCGAESDTCWNECLEYYQLAVEDAPACLSYYKYGNYTFQEFQKHNLARCLRQRGHGMNDALHLDDSSEYSAVTHVVGVPIVLVAMLSFAILMLLL